MRANNDGVFTSLAPARRRLLVTLTALTLAGVLGLITYLVVGRSSSSAAGPAPQAVPGPVLLVPGYGGSITSLEPLAATLRGQGKTVEIVTLPDGGVGDLSQQAVALNQAAHAELAETNARSVDVVGYSAGGVVARLWVRSYGGRSLARRVVTLGSPQHGTQLATLGSLVPSACPTACQQLASGSAVLDQLNAGDETPTGPQWVSVWTTHDNVVVPADSADLEGALDVTVQSLCPSDTVDHSGLPGDAIAQRIVTAALGVTVDRAAPGCPTR